MAGKLSKTFLGFPLASLCLMTGFALPGVPAAAQGSNPAYGKTGSAAGKKEVKFEVISIRPAKPGWSPYDGSSAPVGNRNPTPDGFGSTLTVSQMLMIAYAPDDRSWGTIPVITNTPDAVSWGSSSTSIISAPKWFGDWYVIQARVSDADREAWRNQSGNHELLRSAMRDLLKEKAWAEDETNCSGFHASKGSVSSAHWGF